MWQWIKKNWFLPAVVIVPLSIASKFPHLLDDTQPSNQAASIVHEQKEVGQKQLDWPWKLKLREVHVDLNGQPIRVLAILNYPLAASSPSIWIDLDPQAPEFQRLVAAKVGSPVSLSYSGLKIPGRIVAKPDLSEHLLLDPIHRVADNK